MRVYLDRAGLYVIFRMGEIGGRRAIGFKVKRASKMLFSERYGYCRGFRVGPLWIGTYGKARHD